ncbi:MAG: hypothetical protein KF773_11170 [Deltaproteobacteria bacterium]|nr:hypothetical protein [Deltaproteobacteria bacterium]
MRLVPFVFVLLLGCSDKAPGDSKLLKDLQALEGEACACKDAACADLVGDKVTKLGEATKDFDRDELPKLQAAQQAIDKCLAAANPVVTTYAAAAKAACACKDKKCGQAAADRIAKWAADLKASGKKLRQGDASYIMAEGKPAGECLTKLGVAIPK